jgi:t-SNARE complex subunit (syntaxin)
MLDDTESTRLLREILEVLRDNNSMVKTNVAEAKERAEKIRETNAATTNNLSKIVGTSLIRLIIWVTIVVVIAVVVAVFVIEKLS